MLKSNIRMAMRRISHETLDRAIINFNMIVATVIQRKRARIEHIMTISCAHGRPHRGQNGHLPPLEIGTKKQKFLENVKSTV